MLWLDDIALLCPVRHLLSYIHLVGHRSGALFPNQTALNEFILNTPDSRHIDPGEWNTKREEYPNCISYSTFNHIIVGLCGQLLQRNGPWGTHSLRKTSYLLAVWGGANIADIMPSARHKSIKEAQGYQRDAQFQLEIAKVNGLELGGVVSKWRPNFCSNLQLGRQLNSKRRIIGNDLFGLADRYIKVICGMPPDNPNYSIISVVEASLMTEAPEL